MERVRGADKKTVLITLYWLLENRVEVMVVELCGSGAACHVVTVDCREQLVYDIMEARAMRLSRDTLEWCCGPDSKLFHISNKIQGMRDLQQNKNMK